MTRATLLFVALLVIALGVTSAYPRDPFAEDDPVAEKEKLPADPEVVAVEDDKAKEMLEALDEVSGSRDSNLIIVALEPFVTSRNEDFLKPLEKLTKHRDHAVRIMAVKALGSQEPQKKVGMALLKILTSRQNKDVPGVLAMAVSSLRRVKFDHPRVMKELESHFVKNMHPPVMAECARYFGEMKKYEMVKKMVEWIEAPQPASVNSPSNPPASYWKRMWEIWEAMKLPIRVGLKTMTGKDYPTVAQWKNWLDSREARELGIR